MKNLWNAEEASKFKGDLPTRVYSSRVLGADPELVLHGGGNTSVKSVEKDFFGNDVDVLHIKGSGWDLGTIEEAGFAPVKMDVLLQLAQCADLTDTQMVREQRAAMLNPYAPSPSVEAILHAILPFKYVDHTHANAIVALTNNPDGEARVQEVFGKRVIVVPYVMPGFILAKTVAEIIEGQDWDGIEGMILMNHGIFTFHNDAKTSYDLMIKLVAEAEDYLLAKAGDYKATAEPSLDHLQIARIRKAVSKAKGAAQVGLLDSSNEAVGFANLPNAKEIATQGPLTPDHSIRTKRIPVFIDGDATEAVDQYVADYKSYFESCQEGETILDQAPKFAIIPNHGVMSFGNSEKDAKIISDIAKHTYDTIQLAEATGGWKALSAKDIFDVEYWELEQAKLKGAKAAGGGLQGKVALVTGSCAGIGFACAESLKEQGAVVYGADLSPEIIEAMDSIGANGRQLNLTDEAELSKLILEIIETHGGLDVVVSNVGIFTAGQYLEDLEQSNWDKAMAVNLTSHQILMRHVIPYLKEGIDSSIIMIGSRNVGAPGPGAASYSCSKAALTQLARVAALELAPKGVRVNVVHPDAVFDTKLWTQENLERSAARYNMTVEEYKTKNLLKTEIKSKDIGNAVALLSTAVFGKTTGAQFPVDGGNDRII